jgi:Tfp pilus assembly PilM family ATPase
MSNEISVTGDTVFYNGQAIATLLESQATTLRSEFVDAITSIPDESVLADEIENERKSAYQEGQSFILSELRDAVEPLEDVERVRTIIQKLEESLGE